jgi:O-antigen ligase
VLRSVSHVRIAVAAWGVSTALAGLAGIAQLVVGPDVIPDAEVAWGRVSGTTGHFNTLGGLAAIALVPVVALALDAPRRRMRLVATLSAALTAVGLILSGSVGGFLAAVAAFVCWLALRGVSVRLVLAGVAVTGAFVLVGTTVLGGVDTQSPGERLQSVTDQSAVESGRGGSVFTRLEGYGAAFARIRSDPFVGVGLDEASSVEATGDKLAHNMFLNTWLSGGVLALVGLVIMLSGALRMGVRAVQQASDRSLAASLLAAYVGFLVDGLGEPILFVRYGWMPVALLAALRAQQIAAARRTAVVAPARSHLLVVPRAPARTAGQRV